MKPFKKAFLFGFVIGAAVIMLLLAYDAVADQSWRSREAQPYGYSADVDWPATVYDATHLFRGVRFYGVGDTLNKFRSRVAVPVGGVLPFSRAQVIECARSDYCWLFWATDLSFGHPTSVDELRRAFRAEFIITGGKYPGVTDRPVVAGWRMISLLRLRGNPNSLRPPSEATLQGRWYAPVSAVVFLGILDPAFIRGKTIVTGDVVGHDGYVLVRDNGGRMDIVIENSATNQYWYATEISPWSPSRHRH